MPDRGASIDDESLSIAAGPYVAALRLPAKLVAFVRSTLQDLVVDGDLDATFEAAVEPVSGETYRIVADGRVYRDEIVAELVPDCLVRMLLLAELDAHPERLHLHAGAVGDAGRGVLVAGISGSGKSTLVATLVKAGFDYLSDERAAIDGTTLAVTGFPKPISLVGDSFEALADLDPAVLGHGHGTELIWQVPASPIGSGKTLTELSAHLLVFVQYRPGADVRVDEIHPITAVARLLHDSPDVSRFGPRSLEVCGRLCASVPCVELTYSRTDEVGAVIRRLLDHAEDRRPAFDPAVDSAYEVEYVEPRISVDSGAEPTPTSADALSVTILTGSERLDRVASDAAVVIDGRALVLSTARDEVIELDEVSTAWYMLVDGTTRLDGLIAEVERDAGLGHGTLRSGALQAAGRLVSQQLVVILD